MYLPEAHRCFDEGHVWSCATTADGRAICGRCGYEEPDDYDADALGGYDCLNCGVCDWCIERSIDAAEEAAGE